MFSENEVTIIAIDVRVKEPSISSTHSVYKISLFNDSYINSNHVSSVYARLYLSLHNLALDWVAESHCPQFKLPENACKMMKEEYVPWLDLREKMVDDSFSNHSNCLSYLLTGQIPPAQGLKATAHTYKGRVFISPLPNITMRLKVVLWSLTGRTSSRPGKSCNITHAFMALKQRSKAQVNSLQQPFVFSGWTADGHYTHHI